MDQETKDKVEQKITASLERYAGTPLADMSKREAYYNSRITAHMTQKAYEVRFNDVTAAQNRFDRHASTNVKLFGGAPMQLGMPGDPFVIEAPFPVARAPKKGAMVSLMVILRVWDDISLSDSIYLNQTMVMSACRDEDGNIPAIKKDVILDIMTTTVIMWLRLRGKFFWKINGPGGVKDSRESMFFDDKSKRLMKIMSDDFEHWLHAHSDVNPANERAYKQMLEAIKTTSTNPDIAKGVVPGNLFDRKGDVIYVSCGDSEMARIKEGKVEIVPNGADGIVFAQGKTLDHWDLLDESEGKNPFTETQLFSGANYESVHGRMILTLWFLSLASCYRNYPAILFVGRFRSGKSKTAVGVLELLGVSTKLGKIRKNGEEDFWASLNDGGVKCFDNVDTTNDWIGDSMQLACTGGGTEKRKLFTDADIMEYKANAKIMITSNNPMFASVSGLSDRLQVVQLGPFVAKSGKQSKDSELSEDIKRIRSAAITWFCYTVAKAMMDKEPVAENVNRRHPDFATFALHCARALGKYDAGVAALKSAEFNKSVIALTNDRLLNMIFESIRREIKEKGKWEGSSSSMLDLIKEHFETDDNDRMLSTRSIGKVIGKHIDELLTCFEGSRPRTLHGKTMYSFTGFTRDFRENYVDHEVDTDAMDSAPEADDDMTF